MYYIIPCRFTHNSKYSSLKLHFILFVGVFKQCGKPVADGKVSIMAVELDKEGKPLSEKIIDGQSVILERGNKDKVM